MDHEEEGTKNRFIKKFWFELRDYYSQNVEEEELSFRDWADSLGLIDLKEIVSDFHN